MTGRKHFVVIAGNLVISGGKIRESYSGAVLPPYWKSPMLILNRYSYVMWAGLFRLFPPESR